MINGVLTERTVKEVVPILKTNSDGLKNALEDLVKQYKTKQDDMEKWKVRGRLCREHAALTDSPTEEEQCASCSATRVEGRV
jgi:prefoldin subunit 2